MDGLVKTREQDYLQDLLRHCNGNKEQAAAIADIMYRKLETGNVRW